MTSTADPLFRAQDAGVPQSPGESSPFLYKVCDTDEEAQERARLFVHPNPLIFHHLANTGGEDFKQTLYRSHGLDKHYDAFNFSTTDREKAIEALELAKVRILSNGRKTFVPGHWVGGLDELVGVHHCCFTLLRNPLERFISEFFWRNRHDVESLRFPWRWNNELARWVDKLGEAGHANFYCSEFSTSSVDQRCFHPHLVPENIVNTSASELYAKAVSRLKSGYFFVGITELFEESLFYFARIIGCPALMLWTDLQHHSTTHAVGRGRSMKKYTADTMPIRTKRKLTSLLEADIELYERCREKFEDACKSDPLGGEFDDYKQAVFAGTSAKRRHGETASER